jgi:hypothetical protein
LRDTSEKLLQTLIDNLPDMNLDDSEDGKDEEDDGEEVLPLDFRTALIEEENKVVIQARPLTFKTDAEILRELNNRY